MNHIYTQQTLDQEKSKVIRYFSRVSAYREYPANYQIKMYEYINEMYDLSYINPNLSILNDKDIILAFEFAKNAHEGVLRNYTKDPYIDHPMEMASRLSAIKDITKEEIIAAILHDVVEDCGISIQTIEEKFGKNVAIHVEGLTDIAKKTDGNRNERFQINFNHFLNTLTKTKNIKITDLFSNNRTIITCDAKFSEDYFPNVKQTQEHFILISDSLDPQLLDSFNKQMTLSEKIVNLHKNFDIVKINNKAQQKRKRQNRTF